MKNNFIIFNLRTIRKVLRPAEFRKMIMLVLASIVGAFLDVVGLSLLIPVTLAAQDPTILHTNKYFAGLNDFFGFATDQSYLIFLVLCLFFVFVVKNTITLMINYAQARFAYGMAVKLAHRQYVRYYNRGYLYFKGVNSADIINNIINVSNFFSSGIILGVMGFLTELTVLVFILTGIALYNPILLLALGLVLAPAFLGVYLGTKNKLYNLGLENRKMMQEAHAQLNQSFFGYVDVKLANKEEEFLNRFEAKYGKLNRNYSVRHLISLLPARGVEVIAVMGIVLIFLYSFLVADNPGGLFTFISIFAAAAFRLMPGMNRLLGALMGMKSHQNTIDVLLDGDLPESLDLTQPEPLSFKENLEIRDLSFYYPESEGAAVSGLNLHVKKGERIGVIGESGSGKTTLMNILLRFLEEQEGGIYVDGVKLTHDMTASWRAIVGYVQQNVYLVDASLKENVAFGEKAGRIDEARLRASLDQASLLKFIESLPKGWDTPVGEMGARLSGGQKQRIGIARALYWNSQVLVFDEATSALDMETEMEITESIEKLGRSDKTLFVVAHRITTLRSCDRIIELRDGKLVGEYSYDELIASRIQK